MAYHLAEVYKDGSDVKLVVESTYGPTKTVLTCRDGRLHDGRLFRAIRSVAAMLGESTQWLEGIIEGVRVCRTDAEMSEVVGRMDERLDRLYEENEEQRRLINAMQQEIDELKRPRLLAEGKLPQSPNRNADNGVGVPGELRVVPGLRKPNVDMEIYCGVYFLCQDDEVVYVGQSNHVLARMVSHQKEGRKKFNRLYCIDVDLDQLSFVERQWIDHLLPRYNADAKTDSRRRALERAECVPTAAP